MLITGQPLRAKQEGEGGVVKSERDTDEGRAGEEGEESGCDY